jgi:hypothetical protein
MVIETSSVRKHAILWLVIAGHSERLFKTDRLPRYSRGTLVTGRRIVLGKSDRQAIRLRTWLSSRFNRHAIMATSHRSIPNGIGSGSCAAKAGPISRSARHRATARLPRWSIGQSKIGSADFLSRPAHLRPPCGGASGKLHRRISGIRQISFKNLVPSTSHTIALVQPNAAGG